MACIRCFSATRVVLRPKSDALCPQAYIARCQVVPGIGAEDSRRPDAPGKKAMAKGQKRGVESQVSKRQRHVSSARPSSGVPTRGTRPRAGQQSRCDEPLRQGNPASDPVGARSGSSAGTLRNLCSVTAIFAAANAPFPPPLGTTARRLPLSQDGGMAHAHLRAMLHRETFLAGKLQHGVKIAFGHVADRLDQKQLSFLAQAAGEFME